MSSPNNDTMAPRQRDFGSSIPSSEPIDRLSSSSSMSSSTQPRSAASSMTSRMRRKQGQARGGASTTQHSSSARPGVEFVREQACGDVPAWAGQAAPNRTESAEAGPSTVDAYVVPGNRQIAIATPIEQPASRPLAGLFLQRRRSQPISRPSRPRLLQRGRGRGRTGRTTDRNSTSSRAGRNNGVTASLSTVTEVTSITAAVAAVNQTLSNDASTSSQRERATSPVLTGCRRVSSAQGRSLLDDDDDDAKERTPSSVDPITTFQQQDRYLTEQQNQRQFEQHMSRFQQVQQVQYDATMNHVMKLFPHVSKELVVDLLRQRSLTSAVCLLSQSQSAGKRGQAEPQNSPGEVGLKPTPPGNVDEDSKPSPAGVAAAPTSQLKPATTFGRANEEEQDALLGQMMEMFPHMDTSLITDTMLKHSMQQSIHQLLMESPQHHSSDPNLLGSAKSDPYDTPLPPAIPQKSLSSTDLQELLASARRQDQNENDLPAPTSNSTLYPSLSGL